MVAGVYIENKLNRGLDVMLSLSTGLEGQDHRLIPPFLDGCVGEEFSLTSTAKHPARKEHYIHKKKSRRTQITSKHSCDDYESGVNTLRHRLAPSPSPKGSKTRLRNSLAGICSCFSVQKNVVKRALE